MTRRVGGDAAEQRDREQGGRPKIEQRRVTEDQAPDSLAKPRAERQLPFVERDVILFAGELNAVVVRIQRLHDRLAGLVSSAGPAGHLGQQLERPLGGSEIGRGPVKALV